MDFSTVSLQDGDDFLIGDASPGFGSPSPPIVIIVQFTRAESLEHVLHLGPRYPRARREYRQTGRNRSQVRA